jgi:hypothetical protein
MLYLKTSFTITILFKFILYKYTENDCGDYILGKKTGVFV